ncbi:tetratricopeptide repeat protein [Pseudonocardia sp. CA-142604]|uniref:serine/threonine-protein kinase n=1 Tax=Pseudonocardia sp. CA-142604 TaxID=3240024 RepID=UPI003D8DB65B
MSACARPGCDGTIDDGYCDACGLAPAAPPSVEASASAAVAPPGSCGRPGCDGTIDEGYCDTCGLAPAAAGTDTDAGPSTAAAAPTWSTSSSSGGSGSPASRPTRRGSGRSGTAATRSRLGAGMVDVPPVPRLDPVSALMTDPQVAESERFCSRCGSPVGRSRDGQPGRVEGFCPKDGTRFSFVPKLTTGTLVGGQYDVLGCLAHGGLGWIYLALDRAVNDRPVVLKGLLDAGDADAMAAAVAERRFLAEVDHPTIVKIYNFVRHPDDDGTPVEYIVMDYVGGSSLKQLMEKRRRADGGLDPMPVGQAVAYALEVLPALGYLHARGLVYCDFKPENVIQYDRQLTLIDLGAVIGVDDRTSAVFGTIGYQAPEIAAFGPSPASDVHTVGRTLAVLALGMPPARRGVPTPLPDPDAHPVLTRHPSFDRLLRRATDPDPYRRFDSCDEMAEQLTGVLREVLATEDGRPRPAASTLFGPPRGTFAPGLLIDEHGVGRPDPAAVAALLPVPLVDPADPAAGVLAATATVDRAEIARIAEASAQTGGPGEPSPELRLRLIRADIDAGDTAAARTAIDALRRDEAGDWRLDWFTGIAALVDGDVPAAVTAFDAVYSTLPGEQAPKLALAAASERAGADAHAEQLASLLAATDPALADAAFVRARCRLRAGDRAGAITALDAVPMTSSMHVPAQLAVVEATVAEGTSAPASELRAVAARVESLPLDRATDQGVRAALLTAAIATRSTGDGPLLGVPWREHDLRLALERCLRASARLVTDHAQRVELIDRANAERPRTWV